MALTQVIERIREFRRRSDLTITDLAMRSGVSRRTLSGLDSGNWNPTAATLAKLESVIPPRFKLKRRRRQRPPAYRAAE